MSIDNPGFPPFYDMNFFSVIQHVHSNTSLDIATMTEKQWYQMLVEENITMTETIEDSRHLTGTLHGVGHVSMAWDQS